MLHRFVELSYLLISDTHSFQPKDVWREEKKENNKTHTHTGFIQIHLTD